MKLTCTGSDLSRAAGWVTRIAPTKPSTPVLGGVRIIAADNLTLQATDFDAFGVVKSSAVVHDDGDVVVSAKLLAAVVKLIPDDADVAIVLDGAKLRIQCGRTRRWALPILDSEMWPVFPDTGEPLGTVSGPELATALDRVTVAADKPDSKTPVLTGVNFAIGADLTLRSTDRYRISSVLLSSWDGTGRQVDGQDQMVLPVDSLRHVMLGHEATISYDNGIAAITSSGATVMTRLIAGKFPPVGGAIDAPRKSPVTQMTVDTQELRSKLDTAMVGLSDEGHLRMAISSEQIMLSSVKGEGDSDAELKPTEYSGPELTIALKQRYLADAVTTMGSPRMAFTFTDRRHDGAKGDPETTGFLIEPADADGVVIEGYSHIIMPLRDASGS